MGWAQKLNNLNRPSQARLRGLWTWLGWVAGEIISKIAYKTSN